MRAHTITIKAPVGARARTTRAILALSLAVVLFAATASSASADVLFIGSTTFDFGDRQVGTTSQARQFILLVTGGHTFTPRISVSGDYAQTNDCPPTLSDPPSDAEHAGCAISVTFTPRVRGSRRAP